MTKPEYKLLPCVFCTIGFNSYVAVNKLVTSAAKALKKETKHIETNTDKNSSNEVI